MFPIARRHRCSDRRRDRSSLQAEEQRTEKLDRGCIRHRLELVLLYLHNFPHVFGHINNLVTAYQEGQYQVVEGQVQVLHQQPVTGHTKGDIITVNEKQFEVNYFYATPAYRNTLAHGGVLGSGVYARLYYHNGEILRVDIRK